MIQDIKKLEYRITPQGDEVIDILYTDGTKNKLPVADVAAELTLIDSQIEALKRRRRVLVKMQGLIDANRNTPEDAQITDPDLIQ
jgi:hypothetical protein